jgi:hypothetical protein
VVRRPAEGIGERIMTAVGADPSADAKLFAGEAGQTYDDLIGHAVPVAGSDYAVRPFRPSVNWVPFSITSGG